MISIRNLLFKVLAQNIEINTEITKTTELSKKESPRLALGKIIHRIKMMCFCTNLPFKQYATGVHEYTKSDQSFHCSYLQIVYKDYCNQNREVSKQFKIGTPHPQAILYLPLRLVMGIKNDTHNSFHLYLSSFEEDYAHPKH